MTISIQTNRITYTGNSSTTVFSFPFRGFSKENIQVYLDGVLQTLDTDYTVTLNELSVEGGSITFTAAPSTGVEVLILRVLENTQLIDYPPEQKTSTSLIEQAFDYLTCLVQDISLKVSRCIQISSSSSYSGSLVLPDPEANKYLGWAADALSLVNLGPPATLNLTVPSPSGHANEFVVVDALGSSYTYLSASPVRTALSVPGLATANTFTSGNTFSEKINLSRTGDPSSLSDGDLWYNTTTDKFKGRANGTTIDIVNSLPKSFISGKAPLYKNSNTVTIPAGVSAMSDDGASLITFESAQDVGLNVSGANGLETGAEAANTFYYLWAVRNPSTGAVAGLFTSNASAPTVLPSGYTQKAFLYCFVRNNSSSDIIPFDVYNWPNQPKIRYRVAPTDQTAAAPATAGPVQVVSNNTNSSYTAATATYTPPICKTALLLVGAGSSTTQPMIRTNSSWNNFRQPVNGAYDHIEYEMPLDSGTFEYKRSSSYIYVDNMGGIIDNF